MEDLYDNSRLQGKANLPTINHNPKGIQGIGNQINACKCVTRWRKNIGST
jgi:hypothetical protein